MILEPSEIHFILCIHELLRSLFAGVLFSASFRFIFFQQQDFLWHGPAFLRPVCSLLI